MARKKLIKSLKDIMIINTLFDGNIIVLGGDFRQTLPIVQNGRKNDFINESLLNSPIWSQLEKY